MNGKIHILVVNGISGTLAAHARRYGVKRSAAYARLYKLHWTERQALGIDPPPVSRARGNGGSQSPELESVFERVLAGELTAEEYLRLEGVAPNEHLLRAREDY